MRRVVWRGERAMDLGLRGRTVVVTGGGSGIGAGVSRACLAEGARVVVVGRRTAAVAAFAEEMRGASLTVRDAELGQAGVCGRVVREIEAEAGAVFGLVNCAGVNDGVGLEAGDEERFSASVLGNLVHYYAMARAVLPGMKRAGGGAIVNVSSKVAVTGQGGTSGYAAAKAAQLGLTREWAVELLPYGVRVNAVLPAEVMTPLYAEWLGRQAEPEARRAEIERRIPLGQRMTTAAEMGAAVAFLLSPTQSGHTTGQWVHVDGGYVHLDRAVGLQGEG